jgi:phospholipid-binding lipoprotein MlaA
MQQEGGVTPKRVRFAPWLAGLFALIASVGPAGTPRVSAEPSLDPPLSTHSIRLGRAFAQSGTVAADADEGDEADEYDPWEPFNEKMFEFNRQLDRFVLKPVATGWSKVVPKEMRQGLRNAAANLGMPRRLVHSLLQGKVQGAIREVARFVLNSTVGVGGLADVARFEGVPPSDEDAGQTLGFYGVGPGPYLVLPVLAPSTVRDTIGAGLDALLDPLSFILPFSGGLARRVGETVNERSLTLELFQEIEGSVLDLYSAVRNGYLQRRDRAVRE